MDRRIQRILGDTPHMEHAGSDVALTISSGCLRISTLEGSTVVACHDMPNISFASGGDPVSNFNIYLATVSLLVEFCLHFTLDKQEKRDWNRSISARGSSTNFVILLENVCLFCLVGVNLFACHLHCRTRWILSPT